MLIFRKGIQDCFLLRHFDFQVKLFLVSQVQGLFQNPFRNINQEIADSIQIGIIADTVDNNYSILFGI